MIGCSEPNLSFFEVAEVTELTLGTTVTLSLERFRNK